MVSWYGTCIESTHIQILIYVESNLVPVFTAASMNSSNSRWTLHSMKQRWSSYCRQFFSSVVSVIGCLWHFSSGDRLRLLRWYILVCITLSSIWTDQRIVKNLVTVLSLLTVRCMILGKWQYNVQRASYVGATCYLIGGKTFFSRKLATCKTMMS